MMQQENIQRGPQFLGRGSKTRICHNHGHVCAKKVLASVRFLDGFVAHRITVLLTLKHEFQTVPFGHYVYSLIARNCGKARFPSLTLQECGTACFKISWG